jgi:hypothetical protein
MGKTQNQREIIIIAMKDRAPFVDGVYLGKNFERVELSVVCRASEPTDLQGFEFISQSRLGDNV